MAQDYSVWLRQKTDIGNSQLMFDVLNNKSTKFSTGYISSNGYRYSILRYRATTVPACALYDDDGHPLTSAYIGNNVIGLSSTFVGTTNQ